MPDSALAPLESETALPREPRRIHVSLPLAVLIVGVLYFVWVALIGSNVINLRLEPTVTLGDWVQWGAGLMLILLAILVVDYVRVKRNPSLLEASVRHARDTVRPAQPDDELVMTADLWKGLRVLEYTRPPKSEHPTAAYAKCHVPVDATYVLRVEDLVAEARD